MSKLSIKDTHRRYTPGQQAESWDFREKFCTEEFTVLVMVGYKYSPVKEVEVTCEAPLDEPSYTHRRGRQIVWVTPAAATAAAPCRTYEDLSFMCVLKLM